MSLGHGEPWLLRWEMEGVAIHGLLRCEYLRWWQQGRHFQCWQWGQRRCSVEMVGVFCCVQWGGSKERALERQHCFPAAARVPSPPSCHPIAYELDTPHANSCISTTDTRHPSVVVQFRGQFGCFFGSSSFDFIWFEILVLNLQAGKLILFVKLLSLWRIPWNVFLTHFFKILCYNRVRQKGYLSVFTNNEHLLACIYIAAERMHIIVSAVWKLV